MSGVELQPTSLGVTGGTGTVTAVTGVAPVTSTGGASPAIAVPTFDPTHRGLVPASGGGTANFLRADGTFVNPATGTAGVSLQAATPGVADTGNANLSGTVIAALLKGPATALKSATTSVDVSAAAAPSANQVLTAVDSTHATWQAGGGGTPTLNDVLDPTADKTFAMGGKFVSFSDGTIRAGSATDFSAFFQQPDSNGNDAQSTVGIKSASDGQQGQPALSIYQPDGFEYFRSDGHGRSQFSTNDTSFGTPLTVLNQNVDAGFALTVEQAKSGWGIGVSATGSGADAGTALFAQSAHGVSGLFQSGAPANTEATLVSKQQGASTADLFQAQDAGGIPQATIAYNGQITSALPTGTAPLVVASTTAVANLTLATVAQAGILSGTTGSIGGGLLAAGAAATGTATVTGATVGMAVVATPSTYPGDGIVWTAYVSAADTVTVKVNAILALTPTASVYNVRVIP